MTAHEYLKSENGKKALALFDSHIEFFGKDPAKESGWHYCLGYELFNALNDRLLNHSLAYVDFELKDDIMDAKPEEVFTIWMSWEHSPTAGNILGTDDYAYWEEVKAAFGEFYEE